MKWRLMPEALSLCAIVKLWRKNIVECQCEIVYVGVFCLFPWHSIIFWG